MAVQTTNYQCPACTGPLHYGEASGKLECEFCGSSYSIEEIEALFAAAEEEAGENFDTVAAETVAAQSGGSVNVQSSAVSGEWDTSDLNGDWGAEGKTLRAYSCPACGAELICDETTAATSCPYCGNPTVVPGQFSGALKPNYILPFAISKDEAITKLKKHCEGKFLLPAAFKNENHLQEIKGVYVPFWLFDGEADGQVWYHASKPGRCYTEGDTEYRETDHYELFRHGRMSFEKVPVDASSKMPDDYMDSIEPYDYSEMKPFSTAYLPGYLADRFDQSVEQSSDRADKRCKETVERALYDTTMLYTSRVPYNSQVDIRRGKVNYALLPVWLLTTKYKGKNHLFAINGQTGKTVGNLPADKGRLAALFGALTGVLTVVLGFVNWLFVLG